jgi:O-antigen/teichoic acid export membrane protein
VTSAAAFDKPVPGFAEPITLYMVTRAINLLVGLLMIPLLIHALGGLGFAAWAVLLSASIVFSQLHLGVPTALAFEVAVAAAPDRVSRSWSTAAAFLAGIHVVPLLLAAVASAQIGAWLRLPEVGGWPPGFVVLMVFAAVAARSVLLTGTAVLLGRFRFRLAAVLSLGQALLSNVAATVVAWASGDLGQTLAAFWGVQLAVAAAGFALAHGTDARFSLRLIGAGLMNRLLRLGVTLQLSEWAQTINFQFDKFVVVRVLGLWPAALYEVGNRSALALRSVPASSTETILPIAAQHATDTASMLGHLQRMTLFAVHGVLLFCAAPAAVAPVFLYAWVGEMGYVSRYVFTWLILGTAANLIALPFGTFAQAAGHPRIQARAAVGSIVVNVLLSLTFIQVWGLSGAAFGSSVAMLVGTVMLLREARGLFGTELTVGLGRILARHWAVFAVAIGFGVLVHIGFDHWLLRLPLRVRYSVGLRGLAAFAAAGLYCSCVLAMLAVKLKTIGLDEPEREFLFGLAAVARRRL